MSLSPCRIHRAIVLAWLIHSAPAQGMTLTVPDDAPTIQAAIDSPADTILVRPGHYPEIPTVSRPVVLTAASASPAERPSLAGLSIHPVSYLDRPYVFRGLTVAGAVTVLNDDALLRLELISCLLGSGITDLSFYDRTVSITLDNCETYGFLELYARDTCIVDSCQVTGSLQCDLEPMLSITNTTFQGDGAQYGIHAIRARDVDIRHSIVRRYGIGMAVACQVSGVLIDNVVEDCSSAGIVASAGEELVAARNVVRRCGVGMYLERSYAASENRIENCRYGMWAGAGEGVRVERNVVFGSELDGIQVDHVTGQIRNNTSCLNRGSGMTLRWDPVYTDGQIEVAGNLGWRNGGWGIYWRTLPDERIARVACNNWVGNGSGEVGGAAPAPEDISVEPQFCDPAAGDFRLLASSALADWPGCGQIGALGTGCGLTGTVVVRFVAEGTEGGVRITWELAEESVAEQVWVERSDGVEGPWQRPVTERTQQQRTVIETDQAVLPERTYWYRLMAGGDGAAAVVGPPYAVRTGARLRFALLQAAPNPAAGPVRIEFGVARPAPIEIDIFDVQGRKVASVARGEWPAGAHVIEWRGVERKTAAAPNGWYLLRYRYPGGQDTKRLLLAR